MIEQNPGAAPVEATSLPVPYKDRSAGLIIFGIMTILLGCLAAFFVLILFVQTVFMSRVTHAQTGFMSVLPAMFIYGILAGVMVWLGIGSIMARRWARALLLIFSWSWLITGLFTVLFMAFLMPKIFANIHSHGTPSQPALPPAAISMVLLFTFLVLGIFFIILPAVWTLFYNSRHVKATCEARDSVIRWTDACPLPVLAVCLWLAVSAPMMLIMPVAFHGVTPFFGIFLTGLPGVLFYLVTAAVWSYAAWSLYKLEQTGWWLILVALCVFMASNLLTFTRHDLIEMYQLMGFPDKQLAEFQKSGFLMGNNMAWMMSLSMAPFLAFIIYIRKYLRR